MIINNIKDCDTSIPKNGQNETPVAANTPFENTHIHCQSTTTLDFASTTFNTTDTSFILWGGVFLIVFIFFAFIAMFSDMKKYG